ncbi:MAG: hypothetical protein SCALA702_06160 [Melioribacteraceae bacterium]|nr:MAG: hypothetical protein SCALA702_06160 [Melioribacteraceae bacterium]
MLKKLSLLFVLLFSIQSFAQFGMDLNLVKASYYTSFDQLHPGSEVKFAVQLDIEETWHINSSKPKDDFLIGTSVSFEGGENFTVSNLTFPHAEELTFSFSENPVSVYEGIVYITALIKVKEGLAAGSYDLPVSIEYQACNDASCMPPTNIDTVLSLNVVSTTTPVSEINNEIFSKVDIDYSAPVSEDGDDEDSLGKTLEESGLFISLILIFLGGLALNLTPCVYPLIPITIGYFGGQSEGNTGKLFMLGLFYVLGMALTYSVVGVVTSLSGAVFGSLMQNPIVIIVIAAVLVALAFSMFGMYEFKMPDSWVTKAGGAKSGVLGAFFMGLTMGIVAAPCIGPFVLGLVTAVAAKGDPVYGFFMFFTLAVGLGTPYLFLAIFSGKLKALPRAGFWMEAVKHIFGFILIGMAIYFIIPILPKSFSGYVLPVYMLLAAIYLLLFDKLANNQKGFRIFKSVFSVVIIALAVWMLWPVEKKSPDWQNFTIAEYEASVNSGDKIIIDFYADWCVPCKELDALTFSDQRVIDKSKEFINYKVDMTKSMSETTEEIRDKFRIIGMPTIIFIDESGKEVKRLTGFVNADEFLKIMQDI